MYSLALKILLTLYILYALLKFFEFFFRDEETKMITRRVRRRRTRHQDIR